MFLCNRLLGFVILISILVIIIIELHGLYTSKRGVVSFCWYVTCQAFSNMTLSMRRELCAVMVFAVVDKADTVVLNDGEQLDTWSVILNGHVEISKPDGTIEHLHMGDR